MVSCFLATCPQSHRRPRDLVRRHWSHLVSEATPVWAVLVDDRPAIVAPADDRLVVVCGGLRAVDWTVGFGDITEVSSARSVVYVVDDDGHCYDFTFLDSADAVRAVQLIDRRRGGARAGGPAGGPAGGTDRAELWEGWQSMAPMARGGPQPVDLGWDARLDAELDGRSPDSGWARQPAANGHPLGGRPQPQPGDVVDRMVTEPAPPPADADGADGGAADRIQPAAGPPDEGDADPVDGAEAGRPAADAPDPVVDQAVDQVDDQSDATDPGRVVLRKEPAPAEEQLVAPAANDTPGSVGDPAPGGADDTTAAGEERADAPAAQDGRDAAGPAPATAENGRSTMADEVEDTPQGTPPDGAGQELAGGAEPAGEPREVESAVGGFAELPIEREVALAIARSGGEPIDWWSIPPRGSLPVDPPRPLPIPAQATAHADESVLLVTTETVPGRVVVEVHGDVLAVASWPAPAPAGRSVHEVARDRLAQAVLRRGGNALLGMRYGATGMVGGDVVAYGTAVTLGPAEAAPVAEGAPARARDSADR